jgi:signal transduction histidine kinase
VHEQEIVRWSRARWAALREGDGRWLELREGGRRVRDGDGRAPRCVDFALLRSLPPARLVRLGEARIDRSPRLRALGLREILAYRAEEPGSEIALLGLVAPAQADDAALELLLRTWVENARLRARLSEAEADRAWSRVGREAAGVAHDLRHHLTLASLELERGADEGVRRAAEALSAARAVCDRSLAPRPVEAARELTGLEPLIRTAVATAVCVHGAGDEKLVRIACPHGVRARADAVFLGRLVQNLVLNALEASPRGSPIDVEVRRVGMGEVSLAVRDRGKGMAAAEIPELLRIGRSGSGGTGVGSASLDACARALGAELEIRSSLGVGTEVVFRLRSPRSAD